MVNPDARFSAAEISKEEGVIYQGYMGTLMVLTDPKIDNYKLLSSDGPKSLSGESFAELLHSITGSVLPLGYNLGYREIRNDSDKRILEGKIYSTRFEIMDPDGEYRSLADEVGFYHFAWWEDGSQLSVYAQENFPVRCQDSWFKEILSYLSSGKKQFVSDLEEMYSIDDRL